MAQIAIPNERTVLLDPVTDEKVHVKAMVHIIIERDLVCEGCPSQGFDALHKLEEFRDPAQTAAVEPSGCVALRALGSSDSWA